MMAEDGKKSKPGTHVADAADRNRSTNPDAEDVGSVDLPNALLDQVYKERIIEIKKKMKQLKKGTLPELLKQLIKVKNQENMDRKINVSWRDSVKKTIEKDYNKSLALIAHKYKKLKRNFKRDKISQLNDRKKAIIQDNIYLELSPDSMDIKPAITRNLRRKTCEPYFELPIIPDSHSIQDKRYKPVSLLNINYELTENEIETDVKVIKESLSKKSTVKTHKSSSMRVKNTEFLKSTSSSSAYNNNSLKKSEKPKTKKSFVHDTRVEDGKLLFQKKWYHCGQPVFVEGKKIAQFSAIISKIAYNIIVVKKTSDSSKYYIKLSSLLMGCMSIKYRDAL